MPLLDDTRTTWSARPPTGTLNPVAPTSRTETYLHYIGSTHLALATKPHSACLAQLREYQRQHQAKGWKDLGYNAAVCPHGRAIEGRRLDVVGAHCPRHNLSAYGALLLLGGDEQPTMVQKARTVQLLRSLDTRSGRALDKDGHRDGTATECPGDVIYAWLTAGLPVIGSTPSPTVPAPKPPTAPKPAPGAPAYPGRQLRRSSTGAAVVTVQRRLKARAGRSPPTAATGPRPSASCASSRPTRSCASTASSAPPPGQRSGRSPSPERTRHGRPRPHR